MEEWHDLYVAVAGASAALAGLLFVGVSINLTKILSYPTLPNRAVVSMVLLLSILLISVLLLVPFKTLHTVGYLVSLLGVTTWILITRIDLRSLRVTEKKYKWQFYSDMLFNQFSVLPYIISGIAILVVGKDGLYWIVPAIIFSFIKAVSEAWVLLVEINR